MMTKTEQIELSRLSTGDVFTIASDHEAYYRMVNMYGTSDPKRPQIVATPCDENGIPNHKPAKEVTIKIPEGETSVLRVLQDDFFTAKSGVSPRQDLAASRATDWVVKARKFLGLKK